MCLVTLRVEAGSRSPFPFGIASPLAMVPNLVLGRGRSCSWLALRVQST